MCKEREGPPRGKKKPRKKDQNNFFNGEPKLQAGENKALGGQKNYPCLETLNRGKKRGAGLTRVQGKEGKTECGKTGKGNTPPP